MTLENVSCTACSVAVPHPLPTTRRVAGIDVVRGVALGLMIGYHGCWDLVWFGLARFDLSGNVVWLAMRTAALSTFLVLVGVGLVLARREGLSWFRFSSRVARVAGAAALVSAVTWWFTPGGFIFFGVLHHIALASLLGLAFVGLPACVTGLAALVCLVVPSLSAHPVIDASGWAWLGLVSDLPRTNDYVPLLPWFGVVLLGIALGRGALALVARGGLAAALWRWRPRRPLSRGLSWAGRHSLAIYLLHQLPLLAATYLLALATGFAAEGGASLLADASLPVPIREGLPANAAAFLTSCQSACSEQGGTPTQCAGYCRCVAIGLQGSGQWSAFRENRQSAAAVAATTALVQTCSTRATAP